MFVDLDTKLLNTFASKHEGGKQEWNESISGGTTAALCIYYKGVLVVANLGDTEVMLVNLAQNIEVKRLTIKHVPLDPSENQRIKCTFTYGMYGYIPNTVSNKRVNGRLAVSRALGDFEYKTGYKNGEHDKCNAVSFYPSISVTNIDLTWGSPILITACDGFWDMVKDDNHACTIFKSFIGENRPNFHSLLASNLVEYAIQTGSSDNVTVICSSLL